MTSPRFHTMLSYRRPHPEEHRLAMRLEGWTTTTVYPTLRDGPAGLLRVRLGLYQHSMKGVLGAVPNPLSAQHRAAFDRRAVLALDRELAQALVACRRIADLGLGGDARRLVGGGASGGRLEDPVLLRHRREAAAVLGEVVGGRIDQALKGRFVGLDADLTGRRRHRLHALHRRLVGDLPQAGLDGGLGVG